MKKRATDILIFIFIIVSICFIGAMLYWGASKDIKKYKDTISCLEKKCIVGCDWLNGKLIKFEEDTPTQPNPICYCSVPSAQEGTRYYINEEDNLSRILTIYLVKGVCKK